MVQLLDEARLQTEQLFGNYELGAYEPRVSDRMIVVARPAA
jgi:hypothetical protein